ncbi:hypothetical protein K0817_005780 [Microbacterium sp. HD4P20]|uniref:hypothetical protein n=1 Tax=Microbacterium sp. HD4P20 TaxID=2864874 RepID=UPI001C6424C4|nr:hypothetical protein [Microbacterium sp. HD4P20]MCP2636077.1 hypothetical protein [Microbacterium sp. HD4P20]
MTALIDAVLNEAPRAADETALRRMGAHAAAAAAITVQRAGADLPYRRDIVATGADLSVSGSPRAHVVRREKHP